jgi:predicted GNAT family acetyltransferase
MRMDQLRDNPALSRYELNVDGATAFANYRRDGGVLSVTHTEVPSSLRERGIGSRLVVALMQEARARGFKVRPLCGFARRVIAQHAEFSDLVA